MRRIKFTLRLLDKHSTVISLFVAFIYALSGSLIAVNRYWQFEVFYYDFGIFDKAIWSVSQFSVPIINHMVLGEKIIFADHFSPSIFLLSPLFWIFPFGETLLVAQAVAVGLSGFILFVIGKQLLKNSFFALAIMLCYFLFVGLQNAVITDFHEVTVATLMLMLLWLCILKQKKKLFFVCLILLLGFKETLFVLGMCVAVAMFFLQPHWRKIALITFVISLVWGILSIKFIIPYFSNGTYLYATGIPSNPLRIITSLFDNQTKLDTLLYSFLSFGFLPLLSPPFWLMLLQDFLIRFYGEFPTRWGLAFHYSALTAAIMALSSVYSLLFLQKKLKKKPIYLYGFVFLLLLNAFFLYRVTLNGPFALSYNPAFYQHTQDFGFLEEALAKIPKESSVMAQNNLVTHFTHQKSWHLLSDYKLYQGEYYVSKKPDYILIDNREGQNPNNYYGIKDMSVLIKNLREDKNYKLFYQEGEVMIFKRI